MPIFTKTKLDNVEHQLETARMEKATTDPFFNELLRVVESEIHKQVAILTKVWYMPLFSNDKRCRRENLNRVIEEMYDETEQKCDGLIIIGKCNKDAIQILNRRLMIRNSCSNVDDSEWSDYCI